MSDLVGNNEDRFSQNEAHIILIIHTRLIIYRCVYTLICIAMKIGWTDIQTFEVIGWSADGHVNVALTVDLQTFESP